MKPFPHQQRIVERNKDNELLVHDVGTGKTYTSILWAKQKPLYGTKPVLVIVPKNIKTKWKDDSKQHDFDSVIMSKEEFKKDTPSPNEFSALIVDECFVAGTKVLTVNGYKKIEEIEEGENVVNAIGIGKVTKKIIRQSKNIVKITLKNKEEIFVTYEHPFLTENGWKKAIELNKRDVLLHYYSSHNIMNEYGSIQKTINEILPLPRLWGIFKRTTSPRQKILFETLCEEISDKEKEKRIRKRNTRKNLLLWKNYTNFFKIYKKRMLQFFLQYKKSKKRKTGKLGWIKGDMFKEYVGKQSNEESRNCEKGQGKIKNNRTQAESARWKWSKNASSTKNVTGCTWRRLVCRTHSFNWFIRKNKGKISSLLQNRYSSSKEKNSYRSGWPESYDTYNTKKRQKENQIFRGKRVESVEIQKRKNTTVYNLSVSGHPSYVVNDIVVHNCHHFSAPLFTRQRSQLAESLYNFLKKTNLPRILLTATPIRSTPWNFHTLLCYIGVYIDWKKYRECFFEKKNVRYTQFPIWVPKENWRESVRKLVEEYADVVTLEQCVGYVPKVKESVQKVRTSYPEIPEDWTYMKEWHENYRAEALNSEKVRFVKHVGERYNKVLVVCYYTEQIDYVVSKLKDKKVYVIDGRTKDGSAVAKQAEADMDCYLVVQSSCAAGWQFPSASVAVFMTLGYSYLNYTQTKGRIRRIDNLHPVHYIHVIGGKYDKAVYDQIMKGEDFDPLKHAPGIT